MNARAVAWERGLAALRRYAATKGIARIPLHARAHGVDIGFWADAQRAQYWAGTLHPQRTAALEIVPGWGWSGKHQAKWHRRFTALRRYARTHDVGQIPADAALDRLRLGAWAAAQRAAYAAGTLPARNSAVLETIPGWTWKADHGENHHGHEHGHCRVTMNGSARSHTPSTSKP